MHLRRGQNTVRNRVRRRRVTAYQPVPLPRGRAVPAAPWPLPERHIRAGHFQKDGAIVEWLREKRADLAASSYGFRLQAQVQRSPRLLLLEGNRRPTDSFPLEIDTHLHAVGHLDEEGNAMSHPVILAIESHRPLDLALAGPFAHNRKRCGFGFGNAAYREGTGEFNRGRACLYNLVGMKGDVWILFHVEEMLTLQLAVFHATAGIHAVRSDLDVQNACRDIRRAKGQRGIPLVKQVRRSEALSGNIQSRARGKQ